MATVHRRSNPPATPSAPAPVAGARARALQERIRVLRDLLTEARHNYSQANDRNRHQLQAELERAERACRQAQRQMVELRGQARAAGPIPAASLDRAHPAMELPPEALIQLITPSRPAPAPISRVHDLNTGFQDLDLNWNRSEAANTALDLLQQASGSLLDPSPHPQQGTTAAGSGIDFGPLVEDETFPAGELNPPPVTAARSERETPLKTTPRPQAPHRTASTPPVARPAQKPAGVSTPPDAVRTGEPVRRRTARKTKPVARARSIFRPALLAGVLLGVVTVLVLTRLSLGSPQASSPTHDTPATTNPQQTTDRSPLPSPRVAWQKQLRQQELRIRQAAHERFETLRDRLRSQAAPKAPPPMVDTRTKPITPPDPVPPDAPPLPETALPQPSANAISQLF